MNRSTIGLIIASLCMVALGCLVFIRSCDDGPNPTRRFVPAHAKIEGPENGWFTLQHDFSFFDSAGKEWKAPKGTRTDGASIPKTFLSLFGDRYSQKYVDAAVVHDAYCQDVNVTGTSYQTETWKSVHTMFYEGLLASGADNLTAKSMFAAVYLFGPRWKEGRPTREGVSEQSLASVYMKTETLIKTNDPPLQEIEKSIEEKLAENKLLAAHVEKGPPYMGDSERGNVRPQMEQYLRAFRLDPASKGGQDVSALLKMIEDKAYADDPKNYFRVDNLFRSRLEEFRDNVRYYVAHGEWPKN